MGSLLKQLLLVLEQLLAGDDVVHALELETGHVLLATLEAGHCWGHTPLAEAYNRSLVLVAILSFVALKFVILFQFIIIRLQVFLLDPVGCRLRGEFTDHAHSRIGLVC